MYKLSVLVPSIRPQNLEKLYKSVEKAFSGTFEFVVASPYELPSFLKEKDNVQYIQTWRSPIAAQQQALVGSRGEFITFAADDGVYLPNCLDIAYKTLENEPYTTIVTGKYQEGERVNDCMEKDDYYILSTHESMQLPGVPKDCYMLNVGLIYRSLLIDLGGWDASLFQVCPLAYTDFAIRAYRFGCKFILQQEPMFECGHMPGETGDHKPIHNAQIFHDQPLFNGIYCMPSTYLMRQNISVNNWRNSAEKWAERFKD